MKRVLGQIIPVVILAFCASALPAHAQAFYYCGTSQSMAAKCYVGNAVQSGTFSIPSGMSMQQFQIYGVAVLRILQSGHTYFMVLGAGAAISDAMPATNSDGSANQAAQDAAVNAIVDAALTNGLITLPSNVSEGQVQQFARQITDKMNTNDGPSFSPGGVLRMIDSYMITYTDSSGNVNWTSVSSALNTAVTNMIGSGMIKIPSGMNAGQVSQFAVGVAQAIETYKTATNRKTL
ncbi:MAG TPA: hypothetical protein VLW83_12325 [Candidatus Acidoferrales bacterium]|nr:hypothetical protein [Candidatus Acidoferrales bacterium]